MERKTIYHTPKLSLFLKLFIISIIVLFAIGILFGAILVSTTHPNGPTVPEILQALWQYGWHSIFRPLLILNLLAIVSSIFIWINFVRIDDEGIVVYNSLSNGTKLEWGSIERVKRVNLVGLKYLKIYSKDRRIIYLPLFLKKMPMIHALIKDFSGESGKLFEGFG